MGKIGEAKGIEQRVAVGGLRRSPRLELRPNAQSSHQPTVDVLLRCLKARGGIDVVTSGDGIDWTAMGDLAHRLGVAPLLYHALRDNDKVPGDLKTVLAQAYYVTAARNVLLYKDLAEFLVALNVPGIPVILLKGALLAETIYPNIGLRPMGDIDLLVKERDVKMVETLLECFGCHHQDIDDLGHTVEFVRRFGGEMAFYKDGAVAMDLHWRLFNPEWLEGAVRVDMEAVWVSAIPTAIAGQPALQLSPEDALWYLCIHLALHHQYASLRMLIDVDRTVRGAPGLDWGLFTQRVRAFGIKNAVCTALWLAQTLLETPIPQEVLEALRPLPYRLWAIHRLIRRDSIDGASLPVGNSSERFLHLVLADSAHESLKMAFRAFFPGREWLRMRYSVEGPRLYLYPLLHLLRVAGLALLALQQVCRVGDGKKKDGVRQIGDGR